jgi:predicted RNA-binding protein with PIN domain
VITEPGARAPDTTGLPLPESLLGPLLDAAASALPGYDGNLPSVLRPLAGFDPKRLRSGPARHQLHRALDVDVAFRERVAARFVERPEVAAALEGWSPSGALRRIEEAVERSDLSLLASTLYASRPEGWEFGLGLAWAAFDRQRREKERDDDAKARDTQLATLDEAKRRSEQARDTAQRDVDRLEALLRDERRTRREREIKADRAVDDATRRRQEAEAALAAAEAASLDAEQRLAREADRAREAEARLRAFRREQALAEEQARAQAPGLTDDEIRALSDAARDAQHLAARLESLTTTRREVSPATPGARAPGSPASAAPDAPVDRPAPADAAAPKASSSRARVPCPPGMRADTADALDAMLRIRGVQLIIDGYNVSMAGWRDQPPAVQREQLLSALERLHLRLRIEVVVVFDGADVEVSAQRRRPGVSVIFTSAEEEADPVVIRTVERLPATTPAIVASSDAWVREHAEDAGATVVPSVALLDVLRR